jgi:hypothetical protein
MLAAVQPLEDTSARRVGHRSKDPILMLALHATDNT